MWASRELEMSPHKRYRCGEHGFHFRRKLNQSHCLVPSFNELAWVNLNLHFVNPPIQPAFGTDSGILRYYLPPSRPRCFWERRDEPQPLMC